MSYHATRKLTEKRLDLCKALPVYPKTMAREDVAKILGANSNNADVTNKLFPINGICENGLRRVFFCFIDQSTKEREIERFSRALAEGRAI